MITAPILYNIFAFMIAATSAFALSPLCFPLARRLGAIDVPSDGRRMHKSPVPRAGGLGVFLAFVLSSVIFFADDPILVPILSGGLVIVAAGLADDAYRISPYQKLAFQTGAAVVAYILGARAPMKSLVASAVFSVLWLVLLTNAFNLIDGLDGLCSRVAVFAALGLTILGSSPMAASLAGALAGFLPFNLRPAKMFLGDTGALFAGFTLGTFSLQLMAKNESAAMLPSILLIFALPISDTVFSILRRLAKGKSPFSSDREHFHHKLVDKGFSHGEASLLLSLLSLTFCAVGVMINEIFN
jgi:UDP-GlcNAc:undecaprenyl-phosphate GlcNAc-1-phosphate transferase